MPRILRWPTPASIYSTYSFLLLSLSVKRDEDIDRSGAPFRLYKFGVFLPELVRFSATM